MCKHYANLLFDCVKVIKKGKRNTFLNKFEFF